jgi:hypothetical protein
MRKFFTILSLVCTTQTFAQISITNTSMPNVNDTIRYSTTNQNVSALINTSGANKQWDASDLVANFQDIARFRTPASINILYALSFGSSTYGTESQSLNFGPVAQGTDAYTFYRKTSDYFINTGRAFTVQGIPLSQNYNDTMFRFPLTYGQIDSNLWVSNEVNALVATIRTTGKRVNEVDGWGTITTPYGTFDCLRVKSTLRTTDTVRTSLIPLPFPVTQNTTEYKWFVTGQRIPILEISIQGSGLAQQTTVRYRDSVRPEAFEGLARFSANRLAFAVGNTTDTCTITDNSLRNPISREWTITPSTFRFVGGTSATSQRVQLHFDSVGKYTVSLKVNYGAGSDDTTVENYITVLVGPKANFTVEANLVTTTTILPFTDLSTGNPTSWTWTFNPNTISYVAGTNTNSKNPRVVFDQEAVYDVTLRVANNIGADVLTRTRHIAVFATGLNEKTIKTKLLAFPNPVKDKLSLSTTEKIVKVAIIDLQGKQHLQQIIDGEITIVVSHLASGIYLLKATSEDGKVGLVRFQVSQ